MGGSEAKVPSITVIIPTYNWSSVLPYSIGSVLKQTRHDWELWVVGDGCTDNSEEIVRGFNDPRIHWHNLEKNIGQQGGPNNAGLERSRGVYIAYLGHDDVWLPHHLELLSAALDEGADLAFGWVSSVFPDGTHRLIPSQAYSSGDWLPPTGVMHRRAMVEKVGPWKLPADLERDPESDFWKRMSEAGAKFGEVRRITAMKFPAAARKDIYRQKPHHEQAQAFAEMARNPHFERDEMLHLLSYSRRSLRNRLKEELRRRIGFWRTRWLGYKKGVYQKRRQFKGLSPE